MEQAIAHRGQSSAHGLARLAEERYRSAMQEHPLGLSAKIGLAHAMWERSNYTDSADETSDLLAAACELLMQAYERAPADRQLAIDLASVYVDYLETAKDVSAELIESVESAVSHAEREAPGAARVLLLRARFIEIAWTLDGDRDTANARFLQLETRLAHAHRRAPQDAEILHQWGCTLVEAADRELGRERQEGLRVEACERLNAALRIDGDRVVTLAWLTRALFARAEAETDADLRDRLLRDAEAAAVSLLALSPRYPGGRDNLALILRTRRQVAR